MYFIFCSPTCPVSLFACLLTSLVFCSLAVCCLVEYQPGDRHLPSTERVLSALGRPASQPGHAPALQEPLMTSSRSSKSLSGPHLRPNQPPVSPTPHFEANLDASNPQNPPKTSGFPMFLQCQQLTMLGAFYMTLGLQEPPKSSQ